MEMLDRPKVIGSMKNGSNLYSIYGTDAKKIVGLANEGQAIIVAMELAKAHDFEFKPYEWYAARIWDYSNRHKLARREEDYYNER